MAKAWDAEEVVSTLNDAGREPARSSWPRLSRRPHTRPSGGRRVMNVLVSYVALVEVEAPPPGPG
jgi:hypothetical protein